MSQLKRAAKAFLPPGVLVSLVLGKRTVTRWRKRSSSFLDEENVVRKYLDGLGLANGYCVDVAASDGISSSNTYALFKAGWGGLAVELDPTRFAMMAIAYRAFEKVSLIKTRVIPSNILSILRSGECPKDFSLLSLDIDGYDFFVLDELLKEFRPQLICAEINENIPPPVRFTVNYNNEHMWTGDHFHGQSISKCQELCDKYNYDIVELYYNNLFMVPREINKFGALSPEEAYDAGYRRKSDRKAQFPWNSDMEDVISLGKLEAIELLHKKFRKYEGKYTLE